MGGGRDLEKAFSKLTSKKRWWIEEFFKGGAGGCFTNSDGLSDRATDHSAMDNMRRWSVARLASPSLLVPLAMSSKRQVRGQFQNDKQKETSDARGGGNPPTPWIHHCLWFYLPTTKRAIAGAARKTNPCNTFWGEWHGQVNSLPFTSVSATRMITMTRKFTMDVELSLTRLKSLSTKVGLIMAPAEVLMIPQKSCTSLLLTTLGVRKFFGRGRTRFSALGRTPRCI